MVTLHEKNVEFNSKMTVLITNGTLSTASGPIFVKGFMDFLYFLDLSKQFLEIEEKRLFHAHNN